MHKKTCSFPGCEAAVMARGYCSRHYQQLRSGKELSAGREVRRCSFPGCDNKHEARGYCASHYSQWRDTGTVQPIVRPGSGPTALERRAQRILELIEDKALTTKELMDLLHCARSAVTAAMVTLKGQFYIPYHDPPPQGKGQHIPRYRAGNLVSVKQPRKASSRRAYERLQSIKNREQSSGKLHKKESTD